MRRWNALHPLLFAIAPILSLYQVNTAEIPAKALLVPTAAALVITVLLFLGLVAILKDRARSAVLTSIFLLFFFSYGHFHRLVQDWQWGGVEIGRHRFIFPLWVILLAAAWGYVLRSRRRFHRSVVILNAVALGLLVPPLAGLSLATLRERQDRSVPHGAPPALSARHPVLQPTTPSNGGNSPTGELERPARPDFYYIILDEFASADTLREIFGFDGPTLEDGLAQRGFTVPRASHSNYAFTLLSLASSLSMTYVNDLAENPGVGSHDIRIPIGLARNPEVVRFFKSMGYRYVRVRSPMEPRSTTLYADQEIDCGHLTALDTALLGSTLLRPIVDYPILFDHRARVLCTFQKLLEMPRLSGPKFVFAHLICPHAPYVFDEQGRFPPAALRQRGGTVWGHRGPINAYLSQLIYIARRTEELVDGLISLSKIPPVIIVQSDHGVSFLPHYLPEGPGGSLNDAFIRQRMAILNAFYLPRPARAKDLAAEGRLPYDSITPINTFRLVFNHYFDADFQLLEDRVYYSWKDFPYRFTDVTGRLQ